MITLDTSALIRFFTNDIPAKALETKTIIESKKVFIPEVVFPELEYVLLGETYNSNRENLVKAFDYLTTAKNITVSKEIKKAVQIYKNCNLDIADCIIIAHSTKNSLFSFDKKMLRLASEQK